MAENQAQKRKTGSRICHWPLRAKRRAEAKARQVLSNQRSITDRLREMGSTGSNRERARLTAILDKRSAA